MKVEMIITNSEINEDIHLLIDSETLKIEKVKMSSDKMKEVITSEDLKPEFWETITDIMDRKGYYLLEDDSDTRTGRNPETCFPNETSLVVEFRNDEKEEEATNTIVLVIKELCATSYLNEENIEEEEGEGIEYDGIRTIVYESEKDNLFDALKDYVENFDFDKMISSDDDFDGECLYTKDILSVEVEVADAYEKQVAKKLINDRGVRCDCCDEPINLGAEIYQHVGRCGIYCSSECYSHNHAVKTELTEEVADDCRTEIIELRL